ncbi:hypothetical protein WN51_08435 [Melipona quadrifasciata]|uniref:Uncharacterized protein n=1 Tax=Melipona quadrifasciata TaxID=166423 RepID=A0A0N0U7Q0_9HYME|nr:hypothetical protein WN51_08435 [Melipona quadrifasciata]
MVETVGWQAELFPTKRTTRRFDGFGYARQGGNWVTYGMRRLRNKRAKSSDDDDDEATVNLQLLPGGVVGAGAASMIDRVSTGLPSRLERCDEQKDKRLQRLLSPINAHPVARPVLIISVVYPDFSDYRPKKCTAARVRKGLRHGGTRSLDGEHANSGHRCYEDFGITPEETTNERADATASGLRSFVKLILSAMLGADVSLLHDDTRVRDSGRSEDHSEGPKELDPLRSISQVSHVLLGYGYEANERDFGGRFACDERKRGNVRNAECKARKERSGFIKLLNRLKQKRERERDGGRDNEMQQA